MWLLLHGNGTATDGGISRQLINRTECAIARYRKVPDEISMICFFANDKYPSGVNAHGYLRSRLQEAEIPEKHVLIEPCALSTAEEAEYFAAANPGRKRKVAVCTSFYHVPRAIYFLNRHGFSDIDTTVSMSWSPADLLLELPKCAKDLVHLDIHTRRA